MNKVFALSLLFITAISASAVFAQDIAKPKKSAEAKPIQQTQTPVQTFELPEEVQGEGTIKTKLAKEGYSLTDENKKKIAEIINDYDLAILTNRNSLVYITSSNEIEGNNIFFEVLTIFSKLDSTEVTEGIPADVFDQPEPVYTRIRASANCSDQTLDLNTTEYFDKNNKPIKALSTIIPQKGLKPNEKNIDGQLLKIACEQYERTKKADPKATKSKRELLITPQGQTPIPR